MNLFFRGASIVSGILLVLSVILGALTGLSGLPLQWHILPGIGAAMLGVSVHCLVFALFTGSGKDVREMTEDLSLDPSIYARMKEFKREIFPSTLYGISGLVIVSILGGVAGSLGAMFGLVHGIVALLVTVHNLIIFRKQYLAVIENSALIERANDLASREVRNNPGVRDSVDKVPEDVEWGTHVWALGKFLCFLGCNIWLPYIYFKFILSWARTPFWPFFLVSGSLICFGYYLRFRYGYYRPRDPSPSSLPSDS